MALCSYLSISSKETAARFLPSPLLFILFIRQILRGASNINYLTSAFRRVWSRRGGVMHFGATCHWGSAQGVWIIGELEWFRLEDSCFGVVGPSCLSPSTLSRSRFRKGFQISLTSFYRKGCFWCWSSSVCVVSNVEATEPLWDWVPLCLFMYKYPSQGRPGETLTIWADGRSGQWNDRNCSHGGAGGFPFIFWIGVDSLR